MAHQASRVRYEASGSRPRERQRRPERGSALLVAIIAVLVITVIGIGTIRFAGREVVGAYATSHEQALVACADAARQQLIAQFHLVGFDPSQLQALDVPLGTRGSGGTTTAQGGHYDTPFANIVFDQVTPLPAKATGRSKPVEDLTNRSRPGFGSQAPYKIVARCVEANGRQLEVEFGLQYGL